MGAERFIAVIGAGGIGRALLMLVIAQVLIGEYRRKVGCGEDEQQNACRNSNPFVLHVVPLSRLFLLRSVGYLVVLHNEIYIVNIS